MLYICSIQLKIKTMKIKVNTVEGKTTKKGSKQGRTFTIIEESSVEGFYKAVSDTGKNFSIWNVNGDWSVIGISKPCSRTSYSKDFEICE